MTKPISPPADQAQKCTTLPDDVIQSFNELITENLNRWGRARVTQEEAMRRILSKRGFDSMPPNIEKERQRAWRTARQHIYNHNQLDVEAIYQETGWHVVFDKPGYNEMYKAFFIFSRP